MVDNRGINPVSSFNFKSGDGSAMANKMSEEKNGQGGEYFAQEMFEEEQEQFSQYQDRSAQLRASLNGLAAQNVGSIKFKKAIEQKEQEKRKEKYKKENKKYEGEFIEENDKEDLEEEIFDE